MGEYECRLIGCRVGAGFGNWIEENARGCDEIGEKLGGDGKIVVGKGKKTLSGGSERLKSHIEPRLGHQ